MKSLITAFAIFAASFQALSSESTSLKCTNGELGHDSFVGVTFVAQSGALEVQLHETFFTIAPQDMNVKGNAIAVLDSEQTISSEGMEYLSKVNALFVFDKEKQTLKTTLIMDGYISVQAEILNCKN